MPTGKPLRPVVFGKVMHGMPIVVQGLLNKASPVVSILPAPRQQHLAQGRHHSFLLAPQTEPALISKVNCPRYSEKEISRPVAIRPFNFSLSKSSCRMNSCARARRPSYTMIVSGVSKAANTLAKRVYRHPHRRLRSGRLPPLPTIDRGARSTTAFHRRRYAAVSTRWNVRRHT